MSDAARKAARQASGPRSMGAVSRGVREESKHPLEEAASGRHPQKFVLRLYVTGTTPASTRAIERVRGICEEHLHGHYELEVIDIYQMPELARDHQIIATPTLIKVLPAPLRRFIGDLSRVEKVLFGLELRERK